MILICLDSDGIRFWTDHTYMHWYAWTYQCLDVWEFRQLLSASLPAYCGRPGFTVSQHFPTIHLRLFCRSSRFVAVDLSIFVNLSYWLTFQHVSLLCLCSWVDEICTVTMSFNGSPWIPRCLEALVLPSHFLTFEASKFPKDKEGAGRRHGRLRIRLVLWQPRHGIDLAPCTACCLCTCCIRAPT